jgi:hypothetical protein
VKDDWEERKASLLRALAEPRGKTMPTPLVKTFKAWSWSRYKDHLQCPLAAKLRHLDKVEAPKGQALVRGGAIDADATNYITGKLKSVPASLIRFRAEFKELIKRKASAQTKWAVDRAWKIVAFDDWDRAWGRMVTDAHWVGTVATNKDKCIRVVSTVAKVVDVKSGKVYPENEHQLELYAIPIMISDEAIEVVQTELWYVDQGEIGGLRHFHRDQLPEMIAGWEKRLVPILTDKKFVPRPGDYCGRCHYRKSNGAAFPSGVAPCKFG